MDDVENAAGPHGCHRAATTKHSSGKVNNVLSGWFTLHFDATKKENDQTLNILNLNNQYLNQHTWAGDSLCCILMQQWEKNDQKLKILNLYNQYLNQHTWAGDSLCILMQHREKNNQKNFKPQQLIFKSTYFTDSLCILMQHRRKYCPN